MIDLGLGTVFREIRIEKNLTQEKFADIADINNKYYGKIERGESSPTFKTIYKICSRHNLRFLELAKRIEETINIWIVFLSCSVKLYKISGIRPKGNFLKENCNKKSKLYDPRSIYNNREANYVTLRK